VFNISSTANKAATLPPSVVNKHSFENLLTNSFAFFFGNVFHDKDSVYISYKQL
jgi:hypothetical protein